jgi:hypothetical protein
VDELQQTDGAGQVRAEALIGSDNFMVQDELSGDKARC